MTPDIEAAELLAHAVTQPLSGATLAWDDIQNLARALLSLHAEVEAMRAVVEAACLWRHGVVEIGARLLQSDDGSAEQGMQRQSTTRVLLDAVDAYRARKEGK